MNVQKTPVFRNAMGGFNKRDVTEYITKLSRDFDEIKSKHAEEVKKLNDELASAKEELTRLLEAEDAQAKENASEELAHANAVIAAQTESLDTAAKEKAELEIALSEAKAKLDAYADYDAKMEQYDSMANRMGEIFIGATAEADRIRSEAKSQSEALLLSTQTKCDEYRIFLEKRLDEFATMRKNDLERLLEQTQNEIDGLLNSFAEKSREMASDALCIGFDDPAVSNK